MASKLAFAALLGMLVLQLLAPASARSLRQYQAECPPEVEDALVAADTDGDGQLYVWGTELNYSSGIIRAYTKFDSSDPCGDGPVAVGVEISDSTLMNLPGPEEASIQPPEPCKANPMGPGCHPPFDLMWLDWGDLGDYSPFPVLELDWSPVGHEPPGIYDAPHFDLHFYLVGQEEVMNLTAGPCGGLAPEVFTAANKPIPASCFPGANYSNMALTVPLMGNHLLSSEAPEIKAAAEGLNPLAAWNQTYIWGVHDGEITFMEPMIKRAYLMSKPDDCFDIPGIPDNFAIGGWRPQTYCVISTDDAVRVEMRDFIWFESGCENEEELAPASYAQLNPAAPPLPSECVLPTA